MEIGSLSLPSEIIVPYKEILFTLILYFIVAIPEELGWTFILTEPLAKSYGPVKAGLLIGSIWAGWHIIPWSWTHSLWWVLGMFVLDLLIRVSMVYAYMFGGKSLFTSVIFHAMTNVSMSLFPNYGSHMNPWVFSLWMAVALILQIYFIGRKEDQL